MAGVAENAQLQLVGAVEGLRVQVLGVLRLRQAQDFNMVRTEKVLGQASVQTLTGGACGQLAQMQRNGERNPLAERTIGRKKKRALRQPGMQGDFRGVFVFQTQAVELEGRGVGCVGAFMFVHASPSAARIPRHRVDGDGKVSGHEPRLHQGPQQGDGARGVAAWVADPLGASNARGLGSAHLWKAIHPLRVRAVRRAGVDHAHGGVDDGGGCFAGRGIGQAQDGDIAAVDGLGAAGGVLAFGLGQGQQLQIRAATQAFVDLQTGGALVAIDEDKGWGGHGAGSCNGGMWNLRSRSKL